MGFDCSHLCFNCKGPCHLALILQKTTVILCGGGKKSCNMYSRKDVHCPHVVNSSEILSATYFGLSNN